MKLHNNKKVVSKLLGFKGVRKERWTGKEEEIVKSQEEGKVEGRGIWSCKRKKKISR